MSFFNLSDFFSMNRNLKEALAGNEWHICPLGRTLVNEDYDQIRKILDRPYSDIKDNKELLKRIAEKMCNLEFRQENEVTKEVAWEVYCICENLLNLMCSDVECEFDNEDEEEELIDIETD